MAATDALDDTRRASLKTRSTTLRATIKEWERSFAAAHDGKKPGKSDIKANAEIAMKYKEFQKVGDVLTGKLGLEALQSPRKKQKTDTVRRRLANVTPCKSRHATTEAHPGQIDPYDAPPSTTQKHFLSAIGPTPQRDGKVLGLFDMLSNSGGSHASKNTSNSQSRKRKVDALGETNGNVTAQTPSRKRIAPYGDVLQHLPSAHENDSSEKKKFGRTPTSESKKFMLSHFFATPSASRYVNLVGEVDAINSEKAPLRSFVLGASSAEKQSGKVVDAQDTTPNFLRRSHSFKERLISAKPGVSPPSAIWQGPPVLRRYRATPKPLSQTVRDLWNVEKRDGQVEDNNDNDNDEDNDAMEAMRETECHVQVQDTQQQELSDFEGQGESDLDDMRSVPEKEKVWQKKGQKRTSRKSNMKPAVVKQTKAPKYVAAEESEGEISHVEETQAHSNTDDVVDPTRSDCSDDDLQAVDRGRSGGLPVRRESMEDEFHFDDLEACKDKDSLAKKQRKVKSSKDKDETHAFKPKKSSRIPTINPNAVSHQNFKSLKIRGKNAKPAGAGRRGKFGRRR